MTIKSFLITATAVAALAAGSIASAQDTNGQNNGQNNGGENNGQNNGQNNNVTRTERVRRVRGPSSRRDRTRGSRGPQG